MKQGEGVETRHAPPTRGRRNQEEKEMHELCTPGTKKADERKKRRKKSERGKNARIMDREAVTLCTFGDSLLLCFT